MTDFAAARRLMVDGQVRTADVTDLRLLAAMLELPREHFFPGEKAMLAYLDNKDKWTGHQVHRGHAVKSGNRRGRKPREPREFVGRPAPVPCLPR